MSQHRVAVHRRNRRQTQRRQLICAAMRRAQERIKREQAEKQAAQRAETARLRKAAELRERVQQWADAAKPDFDRIMGKGKLGMGGPL